MSPELAPSANVTPQPFVEGSQPDTSPQITTPEGIEGMVAPGQENLVEQYAREQEEAQQEEDILGKFKSPYELAKAYSELQKKLGQQSGKQSQEAGQAEPESAPGQAGTYTAEQASERYGAAAVESLAEKGVDLGEVMFRADQGQDISEHYEALAETFQVPQSVVEQFVSKAQAAPATESDGLSEADANAILGEVGGQEAFNELQAWGRDNMSEQERASYNAAVDSGNAEAVRWALKSLQARQGLVQQDTEPQLYGGGTPSSNQVTFSSQQQLLDAMNKRNDNGQRIYDVDEAYRNKVQMILAASPEF